MGLATKSASLDGQRVVLVMLGRRAARSRTASSRLRAESSEQHVVEQRVEVDRAASGENSSGEQRVEKRRAVSGEQRIVEQREVSGELPAGVVEQGAHSSRKSKKSSERSAIRNEQTDDGGRDEHEARAA